MSKKAVILVHTQPPDDFLVPEKIGDFTYDTDEELKRKKAAVRKLLRRADPQ